MSREAPIQLILVNENDQAIGVAEKLEAHHQGLLHRAFSVMIFNPKGELLIQRRALGKYHSEGLWANSCCGHPYPDEDVKVAATRRLEEELGFSCALYPVTQIRYALTLAKGLYEREYVHVFHGIAENPTINPDPAEVSEFTWVTPHELRKDVLKHPHLYARWFRLYVLKYFGQVFDHPAVTAGLAA